MKKALLVMALVAGSALAGPRFAIGVGFGGPATVAAVRPACPGPGYVWVDGYYGSNRVWVPGYWRAPVVISHRFVAPRHFDRGQSYDHVRGQVRDRGHDRDRDFHRDFHRR